MARNVGYEESEGGVSNKRSKNGRLMDKLWWLKKEGFLGVDKVVFRPPFLDTYFCVYDLTRATRNQWNNLWPNE